MLCRGTQDIRSAAGAYDQVVEEVDMKWRLAPEIPQAVKERFRSMDMASLPCEQVIAQMRVSGLSIVDSMKLFQELYGVSHAEAKTKVHFSATWSDRRDAHELLHDTALQAIHELAVEDGDTAETSKYGGRSTTTTERAR